MRLISRAFKYGLFSEAVTCAITFSLIVASMLPTKPITWLSDIGIGIQFPGTWIVETIFFGSGAALQFFVFAAVQITVWTIAWAVIFSFRRKSTATFC
jgi:hypothetical protein